MGETGGGVGEGMRRSSSWVEIAIFVIWVIAGLLTVGGIYVAIHFIYKFW